MIKLRCFRGRKNSQDIAWCRCVFDPLSYFHAANCRGPCCRQGGRGEPHSRMPAKTRHGSVLFSLSGPLSCFPSGRTEVLVLPAQTHRHGHPA